MSSFWIVLAIAVSVSLIYLLQSILAPFLLGAFFAYLGDPLVVWLETKRLGRSFSVFVVFSVLFLFFLLGFILIIPVLGDQISYLQERIPFALNWIEVELLPWLQQKFAINPVFIKKNLLNVDLSASLLKSSAWLGGFFSQMTHSGMLFLGVLGNAVLIPVVTFYLLRDWDYLVKKTADLIPRRFIVKTVSFVKEANEVLSAFFKGQLLVMLSLGIVYAVGLWFVGIRLAFLIGLLSGLASIIPYLGFAVGLSSAFLAAFFQFNDWQHFVYVLVVFMIGQFLESSLLTPLLVGDRIGLHPVVVIFSIMAGGQLFGITGMLLALPSMAVFAVAFRAIHEKYMASDWYGKRYDSE